MSDSEDFSRFNIILNENKLDKIWGYKERDNLKSVCCINISVNFAHCEIVHDFLFAYSFNH